MSPRALDLFCGAGGMSSGLHAAGFDVTGVDCAPQPNYPFKFIQCDALRVPLLWSSYDLVVASPPCQAFTAYKRRPNHVKPALNLISKTRDMLKLFGIPYVIENVAGAKSELLNPVMLCGSSFGLDVRRHRYFESSFSIPRVPCDHARQTPRFPPATNRKNKRSTVEVGVWRIPMDVQLKAMGITHRMTRHELSQAIPPAYGFHIGKAALES